MRAGDKIAKRVLDRLALVYGSAFKNFTHGLDMKDVSALWQKELAAYEYLPECIDWAFDNLPEHCPNVIQFRNLCKNAPRKPLPSLPEPEYRPPNEETLQRLKQLGEDMAKSPKDTRDWETWARRIVERHKNGEQVTFYTLQYARDLMRKNNFMKQGMV